MIHAQLLKEFVVSIDGHPVALPKSRKTRALLAYLVLEGNPVSRRTLCDVFFPDTADPRGSLRWSISRLRAAFRLVAPEWITTTRTHVSVEMSSVTTDVALLTQQLVSTSFDALQPEAIGPLLPEFADLDTEGFLTWHATRNAACASALTAQLSTLVPEIEDQTAVLGWAEQWILLAPEDERAWAALVQAIAGTGQAKTAVQLRQAAEQHLRRYGIQTTSHLVTAIEQVYRPVGLRPTEKVQGSALARQRIHPRPISMPAGLESAASTLTEALVVGASRCGVCTLVTDPVHAANASLVLSGAISKDGVGSRLDLHLIQQQTGEQRFQWQMRYPDVPPQASDLARRVRTDLSRRLEIDLPIALAGLAWNQPAAERSAVEHYLVALPLIYGAVGYQAQAAFEALEYALDTDPQCAPALCALGWVRSTHPDYNQDSERVAASERMIRLAATAAHGDAFTLAWAALTLTHLAKDLHTGRDWVTRAIQQNPHSVMANLADAYLMHYECRFEESLERIEAYDGATDAEPLSYLFYTVKALSLYQLGHASESIDWARKALGRNPTFVIAQRVLCAALAHRGSIEEAREACRQLVTLDTSEHLTYLKNRLPYADQTATAQMLQDLRLAGLPPSRAIGADWD